MKNLSNIFYDAPDDGAGSGGETPWTDSLPEAFRDNEHITAAGSMSNVLSEYADYKSKPPAEPSKALANEKGEFVENWMDSLGDDYKNNPSLKNFTTLEGLSKSFIATKAMVGKKQELGEFATDEEKKEFFQKLGMPETAKEYEMSKPEGHPEDMPYEQEQVDWFANIAHANHLTKEQAQGIRNSFYELQKNAYTESSKEVDSEFEKTQLELKEKWGNTYDDKIKLANKAVATFAAAEDLHELGLDNNPKLVKLFANIGERMGEDRLVTGESASGRMTPEDANAKVAELNSNPAMNDPSHPNHKSIVAEKTRLFKVMYPS